MSTVLLAIRAFCRTLLNRDFRTEVDRLVRGEAVPPKPSKAPEPPTIIDRKRTSRSDALTLLAALQREARFVDFIMEPVASYSDSQIGAAVRDIHRDCATLLDRMFAVRPLLSDAEGAAIEVPAGFDAARYTLTGAVSGNPPYRGTLTHHGWHATRCELPQWMGDRESARIVAPAVVEIK